MSAKSPSLMRKSTQVFKNILGDIDIAKCAKTTGILKVLLQNVIHDIIEKKIVPTLVLTFFCVYWTFGICCYSDIIKTY